MSNIMLPNVRLSFPSLWQHESFGGESTGKYAATFILDKTAHAKQTIEERSRYLLEAVLPLTRETAWISEEAT